MGNFVKTTTMDVVLIENLLSGFNFDNMQQICGEGLTEMRWEII